MKKIFLIILKKSTVVTTVESIIIRNDRYMVIDTLKSLKKLKEVLSLDDILHDWAYIGMSYMGMREECAYKWADEMLEFIRKLVFQYAKEMDILDKVSQE